MNSTNHISLTLLASRISGALEDTVFNNQWVTASVASLNAHSSGHCYLELVERNELNGATMASIRATIWASKYRMIASCFRAAVGDELRVGMDILVCCSVTFHAQYGLSLNITDIDPTYTMGVTELAKARTIARLKADGVTEMNAENLLPPVVQRVAVISSESAAGWGDFVHQIDQCPYNIELTLFKATVQGSDASASVVAALEAIAQDMELFDAVVLIRGGGSVLDLACFDDYIMCSNIAQFPLPVVTGIGHQRDVSVADMVAHTSLKTPTAVADFLIARAEEFWDEIRERHQRIIERAQNILLGESLRMQKVESLLDQLSGQALHHHTLKIESLDAALRHTTLRAVESRLASTEYLKQTLEGSIKAAMATQIQRLTLLESKINARNPRNILRMGYSIVTLDGHALRSVSDVQTGQIINIELTDGTIKSKTI
ncbi:MAG: exodeoxyribonuclease VII large subunit [Mucinivorans sp.]